jgi:hypothetical protein
MASRPSPSTARQKFYTEKFDKGCIGVAFYNHSDRAFTDSEIERLKNAAIAEYKDLPWQTFCDAPIRYLVFVDIEQKSASVGVALMEGSSQIACGSWKQDRPDDTVTSILQQLREYADGWRHKEGVRHSLDSAEIVRGMGDVVHLYEKQ